MHFDWKVIEKRPTGLLDFAQGGSQPVSCVVSFPDFFLISIPIQVKLRNERNVQKIKVYETFSIEFEIHNSTPLCIDAQINLIVDHTDFFVAGEV